MPICARCTGFYLGLLIGILPGLVLSTITHLTLVPMTVVMVLGIAPMAIDGGTQYLGWRKSTNGIRLATGLIAGVVISAVITELVIFGTGG
jgi:uncharacterized membrane protein